MEWNDTVSATALKTLKEKKWNKPQILPIVEDISSLHAHLKVAGSKYMQRLKTMLRKIPGTYLRKLSLQR